MAKFKLDTTLHDTASLVLLGSGSYGEVYGIDNSEATKIYYPDALDDDQRHKVSSLCDKGVALSQHLGIANSIAFPKIPALNPSDESIVGFSMRRYCNWPKLSELMFDLNNGCYPDSGGHLFSEESAVDAVFKMFSVLDRLRKEHIVIGDISPANILYNVKQAMPGFIDIDSAIFGSWETDSSGTEGYIDPRVLEKERNAMGGLKFDCDSDVFAMSCVAFQLLTGVKPFFFYSDPPASEELNALRRLNSFSIAIEGENCLKAHNISLRLPDFISAIKGRLSQIRQVKGLAKGDGKDGEYLFHHFRKVFIDDDRDNLLEQVPIEDHRNSSYSIVYLLRGHIAVDEFINKQQISKIKTRINPGKLKRTVEEFKERDPSSFGPFLEVRGIEYSSMIAK